MPIRWKIVAVAAVFTLALSVFLTRNTAAAAPQAATEMKAATAAAPASQFSIPDTTLAINSSSPMSQRIVHYEIDAKYDATKHVVDATEVLTYHNLTGQALDHFPFHLYQDRKSVV